jgi:hypothetical protein
MQNPMHSFGNGNSVCCDKVLWLGRNLRTLSLTQDVVYMVLAHLSSVLSCDISWTDLKPLLMNIKVLHFLMGKVAHTEALALFQHSKATGLCILLLPTKPQNKNSSALIHDKLSIFLNSVSQLLLMLISVFQVAIKRTLLQLFLSDIQHKFAITYVYKSSVTAQ